MNRYINQNLSTKSQIRNKFLIISSEQGVAIFYLNYPYSLTFLQKRQDKQLPRMLPKNIPYDKEFLYEDNWRLKQDLNRLQFELNKANIDKANIEVANGRDEGSGVILFQKLLKKSTEPLAREASMQSKQEGQSRINTSQDGSLLLNFRQQVRQLQKEIEEKDNEILKLKHDQKQIKYQELQIELEEYKEECKRLANSFKVFAKLEQNESKILNESANVTSLLATLKNDNINLSNLIRKMEEENEIGRQLMRQTELERDRIKHKYNISQKQVLELNKQNQFLRQEMYPSAQGQRKQNQKLEIDQLKRMVDERKSEVQQLQMRVNSLEKANSELERRIKEIDQDQLILRNIEAKEKEKLNEKITSLKQENARLEKELASYEDNEEAEESEPEEVNNRKSFNSSSVKMKQKRKIFQI